MDALPARASITLVVMVLLLSLYLSEVQGQSLPSCPIGYQRNLNGTCVPLETLQSCPMGYQRSVSGLCVPGASSQTCPVGYKQIPPGICVPFTSSVHSVWTSYDSLDQYKSIAYHGIESYRWTTPKFYQFNLAS